MAKYFSTALLDNAENLYKKAYEAFITAPCIPSESEIHAFAEFQRKTGYLPCSRCEKNKAIRIKDVIFNDPATIVFWSDGTKTVVKAENEPFDREKGLAMAISKKHLGNKHSYYDVFKKYIKEDTK